MVSRPRVRSFLTALCLYLMATLMIGYFGINAFTGNHGLRAQKGLEQQISELTSELGKVKAERIQWERRVTLLKNDQIDPDMLDERARALLDYTDKRDVTFMLRR